MPSPNIDQSFKITNWVKLKMNSCIPKLQERAQCRMVMVQDGPYTNAQEKPLRIMGDSMRAQRGRDLVTDLLTEKELEVWKAD